MLFRALNDLRTRSRLAVAALLFGLGCPGLADAQGTIKVGVMHSLSGTMAISETTLKDTVLFLIDQQNKKGGLLGKKLEAVVVDPASNWPLFAEKARELIVNHKVAAVFGAYTSVSRKSVLPVFKELNNLLFYPVQYEGEESERNVFYTGAAPNQQAIPAVDYLMKDEKVTRWVLAGTDYVYPRTTNKILEAYLKSKGVRPEDIMINYTPFGHSNWQTIVADIKKFGSAGKKTAVISTINGDANVPFYRELGRQGVRPLDIPVLALSIGEEELAGIDTKPLAGHLAAANYLQAIKTPANENFIRGWREFTRNPRRETNDPMEAHYIGFNMWIKAVEKVGSVDPDRVIDALPGIEVPNLTGGISTMLPNHHITKPVFVAEVRTNGQFDLVWKSAGLVPGDAWSKELDGSKNLIGDWVGKKCGAFNVRTNACTGPVYRPTYAAAPAPVAAVAAPPPPPAYAAPTPPPSPAAIAAPEPDPQPVIAALPPPAPRASPDRRVALVIGNSNYKNVSLLPNPVADARLISDTLKRTGFDVTLQTNLAREELIAALRRFADQAETADWAMIYFAGHGMEVAGTNYLIPVDARLASDRDAGLEAVALDQLRHVVGRAKRLRLIVLDACRDNPFANQMKRTLTLSSRSVSRGFTRVEPDAGSLIVYSAKDGEIAADGTGANSPFALALSRNLLVPGLEVRRLFDTVRDDVLEATNQQQQPFSYASLSAREDYYFVAK